MLAKTIPTERATMIAAMTMVRRLRNLRAMGSDLLPGKVSRFPRLINDVRKIDFGSPLLSVLRLHGVSNQESACDNRIVFGAPAGD